MIINVLTTNLYEFLKAINSLDNIEIDNCILEEKESGNYDVIFIFNNLELVTSIAEDEIDFIEAHEALINFKTSKLAKHILLNKLIEEIQAPFSNIVKLTEDKEKLLYE